MDEPGIGSRQGTSAGERPPPPWSQTCPEPWPDPTKSSATLPSRTDRLRSPLLVAATLGVLTLALRLRDPHVQGSWGGCPWSLLTGQYCPGCGALRAVNELTHGDLLAALSSNLLFVLLVPVLVLGWLRWASSAWTDVPVPSSRHPRIWIVLLTVVMLVFVVLRTLPVGAGLAP